MSSNIQVTPEQLRTLAKTCSTQAGAVGTVRSTVTSSIQSTDWNSPAAERFENDWNTHYVKMLQNLETALTELGTAATTMATNYDSTEASYKGVQ